MADFLLNKVINDEITSKLLIKWLLKATPENEEDFKDIFSCNVGQIDFITYFLNFLHEEVPCDNKLLDTPQKANTPKRIDKVQKSYLPKTPVNSNTSLNSSLNTSIEKPLERSTPKNNKAPANARNDSYFSPISPLYQKPNQNSFSGNKSGDKHSICFGDFLVNNSRSTSKKKKQTTEVLDSKKDTSRRIKPTSIFQVQSPFQKTDNSFNFQKNEVDIPVQTADEQRNLLVEERKKIVSRKESVDNTSHPVLLKRQNSLSKSEVKPVLSLVTFKNNLNSIVDIYTAILDNKLVLNISSEIYFLISLLLSRQQSDVTANRNVVTLKDCDSGDSNLGVDVLDSSTNIVIVSEDGSVPSLSNVEIFESFHNVIYFAVKCLETQVSTIRHYDRTTLRLLADNERLRDFSLSFSKKLWSLAENKPEKLCIEEIVTPISHTNVCFNIDTDNKENFPDQLSFHAFRKQRDLFYEILRIWETQHLAKDWNFSLGLGGKIRSLFALCSAPTNFMHLARLFKNQLLSSCSKGPKEKGLSENSLSFLPPLAIDKEKLDRLTNRLVTKQASNGINSLPAFSGYQEFFKEFIVVSSSYFFNKHLCDILVSDIVELNDTKFSSVGLEEESANRVEVDVSTRKLYIDCIKNLRILAKFLGFIESLPYKSDSPNIPKKIVEAHIRLRQQSIPQLDVKTLLQQSLQTHTVIFIIPWLTKYFAMLDFVTLRLPYYMSVIATLFDICQNYDTLEVHDCNAAVVRFCLGWLFELPHFPDVEYFSFCMRQSSVSPKNGQVYGGLDQMEIANQNVLYLCCPYLEEIKKLLSSSASGSKIAVKYITPITAVESNSEMAQKRLEQQLEEAFFSGQPTSLRKTVEFVSERISSTAVKCICHDLVPKCKESAMKVLKEKLFKSYTGDRLVDANQGKESQAILKKEATSLAQIHFANLLQICDREIHQISHQKIPQCIDSLLPVDTLEETKNVCIRITNKMYLERVKQWINSHVTVAVFTKDFDSEVQKFLNGRRFEKEKVPFILPGSGRNCEHREDTLSGFHMLNNIREASCRVTEKTDVSIEYVKYMLQETHKTLTQRNDVNDMISTTIAVTVFDFCLLLASEFPSYFSDDFLDHFVKIWERQQKIHPMFKSFFCPRNIKILQTASDSSEAWNCYAKLLSCLLNRKLIEHDDLESQCVGFFNRNWDEETLQNFTNFLGKLVKYSKCDNFGCVLDFLSDFCSDLLV